MKRIQTRSNAWCGDRVALGHNDLRGKKLTKITTIWIHQPHEFVCISQMRGCMMPMWSTTCRAWTRPLRNHSVVSSQRICPPSLRKSVAIVSLSMGGMTYQEKVLILFVGFCNFRHYRPQYKTTGKAKFFKTQPEMLHRVLLTL